MLDPFIIGAVAGTFLIAGMVKGVIGLGLPTVSLALLAVLIDLPSAMALLIVPSLVTNLWQALAGSGTWPILRRIWPFLIPAAIMIWVGSDALVRMDHAMLSRLLGGVLILYAAVSLAGLKVSVPVRHERWTGVLCGAVNGALTGMTGSFVVPGVMYLQALGLTRDYLIQAMGMLFTVSTLGLAVVLQRHAFLTVELTAISGAALAPAVFGMLVGQRLRRALSEEVFRRVFFLALLTLGAYIIVGTR